MSSPRVSGGLSIDPPLRTALSNLVDSHPSDDQAFCSALARWSSSLKGAWAKRLGALCQGAQPRQAASRLLLLPPSFWAQPWPKCFDPLFHEGSYAVRLLGILLRQSQDPSDLFARLAAPLRFATQDELVATMRQDLAAGIGVDEVLGRLRSLEYLRLIRAEYEQARLETICGGLSRLAASCVQIALEQVDPKLADHLVVFGMGKLGGQELNFLSDIDLIFFHDERAVTHGDDGIAHRRRNQLFTQIRQVLRTLEGQGDYRPLFRVDLRLRPFGSRGPLSMSAQAAQSYYERYGRDWERQAWLRAKPIAGNLELGRSILSRLAPFVYRRNVSPAIFAEIQELMARARSQADEATLSPDARAFNLKLDRGGIREIEFFVQALQLLNAGKNPSLMSASTLRGLDRLASQGLISDREHEILGSAYRRFRKLEHRVQIDEGQQTHQWPHDEALAQVLFRREAQLAWDAPFSLQAALQELHDHRVAVLEVCATLQPSQAPSDTCDTEHGKALAIVCDPGARPDRRIRALATLGLRDPHDANALIEHLWTRRGSAFCEPGPGQPGAVALLMACLECSDPDGALLRLSAFSSRYPAHVAIWRIFATPSHQDVVRQVADLFGVSEPLSQGLISYPSRGTGEATISLLHDLRATSLPTPRQIAQSLHNPAFTPYPNPSVETLVQSLAHFKHAELLRIGLFDLGHRPGPAPIGRCLSHLADLVLRTLFRNLCHEFCDQPKAPSDQELSIAVIALGKYGMRAMDYGSDLDLMFVYDAKHKDPAMAALATKLVGRLTHGLSTVLMGGRLYEVDTRLRPSGRSGLLVSSLAAFTRYHQKPLPVWERVAMLWARGVAEVVIRFDGRAAQPAALPGPLCNQVTQEILVQSCQRGPRTLPELMGELQPLKTRIETELAREDTQHWDLKSGKGGCMDFEFLVSALQLSLGLTLNGDADFFALAQSLEPKHLPAGLCRAYQFQRQVLNRLRLSAGSGHSGQADRLHLGSPRLAALARRMGRSDASALLRALAHARAQIEQQFWRVGAPPKPAGS